MPLYNWTFCYRIQNQRSFCYLFHLDCPVRTRKQFRTKTKCQKCLYKRKKSLLFENRLFMKKCKIVIFQAPVSENSTQSPPPPPPPPFFFFFWGGGLLRCGRALHRKSLKRFLCWKLFTAYVLMCPYPVFALSIVLCIPF